MDSKKTFLKKIGDKKKNKLGKIGQRENFGQPKIKKKGYAFTKGELIMGSFVKSVKKKFKKP
ncbi:MAG: hypothetical protein CM15mV48_280 [uncultured marine virus]|nr:MAG: hypothetical protein CM15mV48_280 [uncultured marine virus]